MSNLICDVGKLLFSSGIFSHQTTLNSSIDTTQKPPTIYPKKLSNTNQNSHARRDMNFRHLIFTNLFNSNHRK